MPIIVTIECEDILTKELTADEIYGLLNDIYTDRTLRYDQDDKTIIEVSELGEET